MSLAAMWAAVTSKVGRVAVAIATALGIVFAVFLRGRRAGIDEARADAAADEQKTRRRADAAAAAAERDGADRRLRDGNF